MRRIHNSFAKKTAAEICSVAVENIEKHSSSASSSNVSSNSDKVVESDAFHFIGYVPVNNYVYELDGLSDGPVQIGPCTEETWLDIVKPAIKQRISR